MNADFLEPKSGTVAGQLAAGVVLNDEIRRDYVVQEMTGVEEDLLAGKGDLMVRLNQVILNCMVSLGGVNEKNVLGGLVRTMTAVDRMILLIAIRRASLGDIYRVKYNCPSCSSTNNASVDLSALEVTPASSESNEHLLTLGSGREVKWHTMTGQDEEWLQSQQKRQEKTGRADIMTLAMLTRVDEIDGEKVDRKGNLRGALGVLKALRLSERNELRESFKGSEGAIDTEIEYECASCGHEFAADLDVGQVTFFFPSGI